MLRMNPVGLMALLLALAVIARVAPAQCIVQELHADGSTPVDSFGIVASAGDVLAAGDVVEFQAPGRVYVFRRIDDLWVQEAVLIDPDVGKDTGYYRPATNGEVILVGAPTADGAQDFTGAVHVYRYNQSASRWEYETRLYASDGDQSDSFGYWLAIDGDVAVITARDDEFGSFSQAGSAYVFRYDRATRQWREEQKLHAFTPATYELFGKSVDVRGDRVIVGANGVDQSRGAAYVFRYDGRQWIGEGELRAFDATTADQLGWDVHIRGDFAAAGAHHAPSEFGPSAGAAYTFVYREGRWTPEAKLVPSTPSKPSEDFGLPIKSTDDGRTLAIGCFGDSFGASWAGSVYVFRRADGKWTQTGKLGDPHPNPHAGFSSYMAINDDQVIVGAPNGESGGHGAVFVFNGINQRDCDGDGEVDACQGVSGPDWRVTPARCNHLADLDGDGSVGATDLQLLLSAWGRCVDGCAADLDADGAVSGFDLAYLLGAWGAIPA